MNEWIRLILYFNAAVFFVLGVWIVLGAIVGYLFGGAARLGGESDQRVEDILRELDEPQELERR